MRSIGTIAGLVLFGYFAWFAARGLLVSVPLYRKAAASASWPSTQGTVTASTVESHRDPGDRHPSYDARVTYEYTVNNTSFRNDRIRFGAEGDSSETSQREVASRFPAGSRPRVYFDPADPVNSTLLTGGSAAGIWVSAILLGLCLLAVGALISAWLYLGRD